MPILVKKDKLEELVSCVKCPFNALKVERGQCFCEYPTKIYKNTLGPVSLGSIKSEIIDHCANCEFKKLDPPTKSSKETPTKVIPIDEYGQVKCPSSGECVSPLEDCKACVFFAKTKMKAIMKEKGGDYEMKEILCHNPHIPPDNLKLWLDKKTREDPKSGVVQRKK